MHLSHGFHQFLSSDKEKEQDQEKGPLAAGKITTGLHAALPVLDIFAAVHPKLADKIHVILLMLDLEFVDMARAVANQ